MWRILVDFKQWHVVLLMGGESGNLSAGNHPLRRLRNLPRTSGAKCSGNLEAAADFEHRDNVIYRNAFDEPEPGRCDIDGSLSVVQRIRLIGAARSQLARELHGVFATGKFDAEPMPNRVRNCCG